MRSLFFIGRHGETILNESNKYRGWSDGPDAQLDEDGIQSAHAQGQFLASLGQKFKIIVSSPLGRAQHTAAIVAGYLDVEKIIIDPRLYPLNVGDLAGQPKEENPISPYLKDRSKKFPGGESVNMFEARQHSYAQWLLAMIEAIKAEEDVELLTEAHVSNTMYWWNVQTNAKSDEYLDERTDLVKPGGISVVTEHSCIPIFRANETNDAEGGNLVTQIGEHSIKGEPGTGYEPASKGPFMCSTCEYFRSSDLSCGQKDFMAKSKLSRTADGRVKVEAGGCCVYHESEEKR